MSCNTCTKSKPIPVCAEALVLGIVASHNTAVKIRIVNNTLNSQRLVSVTSSIAGLVTLPMADLPEFLAEGMDYEISVELADGTVQPLTISSIAYDCIRPVFQNIYDEDGAAIAPATYTVIMDV
jgi:hypothetical protein